LMLYGEGGLFLLLLFCDAAITSQRKKMNNYVRKKLWLNDRIMTVGCHIMSTRHERKKTTGDKMRSRKLTFIQKGLGLFCHK
jgi:hypothetical protein